MKWLAPILFCVPLFAESGIDEFLKNYEKEMEGMAGNSEYLGAVKGALRMTTEPSSRTLRKVIVVSGPSGFGKTDVPRLLKRALSREENGERVYDVDFEYFEINGSKESDVVKFVYGALGEFGAVEDTLGQMDKLKGSGRLSIITVNVFDRIAPEIAEDLLHGLTHLKNAVVVLETKSRIHFVSRMGKFPNLKEDLYWSLGGPYERVTSPSQGITRALKSMEFFEKVTKKLRFVEVEQPSQEELFRWGKYFVTSVVKDGDYDLELSDQEIKEVVNSVKKDPKFEKFGMRLFIEKLRQKMDLRK